MRIDVHTHIFPPEVVENREGFFDHEPVFRLLYDSPKARLATAESLLEAMDRDEVDYAVVFGFPWQNTETSRRHNDYVLEAAQKYGHRLIPLGCVAPFGTENVSEAERCLRSGARGLGELAVYEARDAAASLENYQHFIDCCRRYQGVLLIHANEAVGHQYPGKAPFGLDFYYALAKRASEVTLILAHWGGGLCFYELLKKEVPQVLQRVHYDTAASPYLYRTEIYAHMARTLGKEKILFGSDYPLLAPGRYFQEMENAGLSPEEIEAISGGNAARLFGIECG